AVVETAWEDPLSETLEKEVQETRRMVSALQALLLHGSLPEDEQDVSLTLDQCNAEQQLVVIRSRLDQSMEEAQELKLLAYQLTFYWFVNMQDAQQQRLCTQEASILQMKQELLRASMTKDELNNQNVQNIKETGQKDRLLQQLKHKLEESQTQQQAEEVQLLRDALRSLRNNFRDHDPQHHTLDTLEQGIVSLIDRLHSLHTHRNMFLQTIGSSASTKILYFTGKSPTPSMINILKRCVLGEVTLKDVKAAVDREGNYRYHFKALDPEFGTVKEEVFLDGAIVPGWEGKIVAWVEEDRGDER
uniref:DIX domain containing 1 n=1 Tax=Seriola dumerili TaxID=41447 RepID=A0A3B4TJK9_SERDU